MLQLLLPLRCSPPVVLPTPSMDAFWTLCLQHFEQSLPPQQFRTWIQPLRAHREGSSLILEAPNRFVLQWVKDRFLPVIEQLARDRNEGASVLLELGNAAAAPAAATAPPGITEIAGPGETSRPKVRESSRLNPAFTF